MPLCHVKTYHLPSENKMVLTLYKLDASPPVRAVNMVIEALGLEVETVTVNILNKDNHKDEYLQMNPQHTIPTLKDDDFVIWDSHAITTYLITKYGKDDSLYPSDPKIRARIDQRLHFDSGVLFATLRNAVGSILYQGETTLTPEHAEKIKNAYEFTEKFLTSQWLVGDHVTIADICCVATISSMNVLLPIDEGVYPNLAAWVERCSALDFYIKGNKPGLEQFTQLIKSKLR